MARPRVPPPLAVVLALTLAAGRPAAGQAGVTPLAPRPSLVAQADSAYRAGDVRASLRLLELHLGETPGAYPALWRWSRSAVAMALAADADREARDRWLELGVARAEEAVRMVPAGTDARYWALAAKGRLALHQGPKRTADLGLEVYDDVSALLALDSLHAGAHNALGRLHYEVMTLAAWKRWLAKVLVGGALRKMSWEGAETHLRRAAELEPGRVLYLRDLGALYVRTRRPDQAREALEAAVGLSLSHPADLFFQREAAALLGELVGGTPALGAPLPGGPRADGGR